MLVAAVEAAEAGQGGGLGRGHVVVDPHPPARVEAAHRPRQRHQQLRVPRPGLVIGPPVGLQPGEGTRDDT